MSHGSDFWPSFDFFSDAQPEIVSEKGNSEFSQIKYLHVIFFDFFSFLDIFEELFYIFLLHFSALEKVLLARNYLSGVMKAQKKSFF